MSNIIIGITGSVAAYKAADLVSQLKKKGHTINVCMSQNSTNFIAKDTFVNLSKNNVLIDTFEENDPTIVKHIELAKNADLIVIAPASANTIAKIANGIADNMLTNVVLAAYDKPLIIAPAMNTKMYENPITQENINKLKKLNAIEVEPKTALLACNDVGKGALANITDIILEIEKVLQSETSN
ncbi:flavoprotein [Mycoplasma sp. P36-A1]|uniref:flavoprotein n=1 Tax=Mycoplasma sp. P36-A1 TaxID=3252900 RepID=UPI003C2E983B